MERYKLGKLAPKFSEKTLLMSRYVLKELAPPPDKVYWEYKVDPSKIGMLLNDQFGDCVVAGMLHYLMLVTAHSGAMLQPTDADAQAIYTALSPGFDPVTDANDNGVAITDALNYWQTVGLLDHKILGWAQLDHTNRLRLNQGVWLFLATVDGVQLPASAQTQFPNPWEVVENDQIEGGHCILGSGYGSEGRNYETWGKGDQKASNAWVSTYLDESYVVFTEDLINKASGLAPNHFKADELYADLKLMAA